MADERKRYALGEDTLTAILAAIDAGLSAQAALADGQRSAIPGDALRHLKNRVIELIQRDIREQSA